MHLQIHTLLSEICLVPHAGRGCEASRRFPFQPCPYGIPWTRIIASTLNKNQYVRVVYVRPVCVELCPRVLVYLGEACMGRRGSAHRNHVIRFDENASCELNSRVRTGVWYVYS